MKKSTIILTILAIWTNASLSSLAFAHPHSWIDYEITPKFDQNQQILGLVQTWTFDPYYSVFLLEEQKKLGTKAGYQARLTSLGKFMLKNMAKANYFTRLEGVKSDKAEFLYLKDINSRMQMQFYLPFIKNSAGAGIKAFKYRIYDPTYYINMEHKKQHKLKFNNCSLKISKANPSQKAINQALALDKMDTPTSNIGILFADTGSFLCKN